MLCFDGVLFFWPRACVLVVGLFGFGSVFGFWLWVCCCWLGVLDVRGLCVRVFSFYLFVGFMPLIS